MTYQTVCNLRVGAYYGAGSLAILFGALLWLPWTAILFWPGIALFVVMIGYFRSGENIFHKTNGRIPILVRVLLGPVFFGHYWSLKEYSRHCRAWDVVTPNVWVGRVLTDSEAREAISKGVASVLDLTGEFSEARPFLAVRYRNLPVLDLTAPRIDQLREALDFISVGVRSGIVYVHCKIGYSRSAAVICAYLIESRRVQTAEEAIKWLRRSRPSIVVRPEVEHLLRDFEQGLAGRGFLRFSSDSASRTEDPAKGGGTFQTPVRNGKPKASSSLSFCKG